MHAHPSEESCSPREPIAGSTEDSRPDACDLGRLSASELVARMAAADAEAAAAVLRAGPAIARAIDALALRFAGGGRLIYAGAGTSGRLGVLDAAECPPTFGADPRRVIGIVAGGPAALARAVEGAEDDLELGRRDLAALALEPRDALVAISASGRTPYALGALHAARAAGALSIALVCNPGAPLARAADLAIELATGPEVLAGSTRLKAGSATKMTLNMLSTGLFARMGCTLGDQMRYLRGTNAKLFERAARILAGQTGLAPEAARAELRDARAGELAASALERLRRCARSTLVRTSPERAARASPAPRRRCRPRSARRPSCRRRSRAPRARAVRACRRPRRARPGARRARARAG